MNMTARKSLWTNVRDGFNDVTEGIPDYGKKALLLVTLVVGGTTVSYFVYPSGFLRLRVKWARRKSGMRMRSVTAADGSRTCYGEWGQSDKSPLTVVMVHGLGGSVDNWVPVVQHLPKHIHCLAVEMPGQGQSTYKDEADLSMDGMARRLKQVLDDERSGVRNKRIHLVGAAMGGTVVTVFAAQYPSYVHMLSLICPAMRTTDDSDFIKMGREGLHLPIMPRHVDDMRHALQLLLHNPPKLSRTVLRGLVALRKPYNEVMNKVSDLLREEVYEGDEDIHVGRRAADIRCPTQVIWGRHDRIIDVSGADLLKSKLRRLESFDILNTGHSIFLDNPKLLAQNIQRFHEKWSEFV